MESKKFAYAYVIPLHKKDEKVFRAIESIPEGDYHIVLSTNKNIKEWILSKGTLKDETVTIIVSKKTTYPVLVNAGVEYAMELNRFDYINILEFDDTVMERAHLIVDEYANDWEDADILAPLSCIVKEVKDEDEKPILVGIGNEVAIAPNMAEDFGYFDFNMMLRSNFIFVNGCYIKPRVFIDYGMFKENFKMFYDYEWALRMVYNGVIIRTIPKATHFHSLTEDGALETQRKLPRKEIDAWLGAARREYFFEVDRDINFDE